MPLGGRWIRAWRDVVFKECPRAYQGSERPTQNWSAQGVLIVMFELSTGALNASWGMVDSCMARMRERGSKVVFPGD